MQKFADLNQESSVITQASFQNLQSVEKLYAKEIKRLNFESKQVKVHGKSYLFQPKDPIFFLQMSSLPEGEDQKKIQNRKCSLCNLPNLILKACNFCREPGCDVCCRSVRKYPAQQVFQDEEPQSGRLCRLCDRKFMMYVLQENEVEKVVEQNDIIKRLMSTY